MVFSKGDRQEEDTCVCVSEVGGVEVDTADEGIGSEE